MRILGYLFILIGLVLLLFVGYLLVRQRSRLVSPVPDDRGVKVIFITPEESN